MKKVNLIVSAVVVMMLFMIAPSRAQEGGDQTAELAKKLSNPVAAMISVPLQSNWDFGYGTEDATRYTLNVQPVIPFPISKDWNLITRTIVPIISAESPVAAANAFWSLTLYELPSSLLTANPLNRYILNSPMLPGMKRDTDGGLTLYVQHESPGKDKEANWLPAPNGPFWTILRLYWPQRLVEAAGVEARAVMNLK